MGWTSPANHVYVVGELVTPATLNTYVKDNLIDLDRRASFKGDAVETQQETTSLTYVDLTTVGPQVSIEIGQTGEAMVNLYGALANLTGGQATHMAYAISGATTRSATDDVSIAYTPGTGGRGARIGASFHVFNLNPGVHTFTAKYRCSGGTGNYANRRMMVVPFGA